MSEPFTVLEDVGPVSYPALARRGGQAMLIATAQTPVGHEVEALPISPLGESAGEMVRLFHRGLGGSISSFRRSAEDGAYWVVIRDELDTGLFAGILSERAIAASAPLPGPPTDTIRPGLAASEEIAVLAVRTVGAPLVEVSVFRPLAGTDPIRISVEGDGPSATLIFGREDLALVGVVRGGEVVLRTFDARGIVVEERPVDGGDLTATFARVVSAPNTAVVASGVHGGPGRFSVSLLFDQGGVTREVSLDEPVIDLAAAWDGLIAAAMAVQTPDGPARVWLVATDPTDPAGTVYRATLAETSRDPHPALLATGDATWPFLVVWDEPTADGLWRIVGRRVRCPA